MIFRRGILSDTMSSDRIETAQKILRRRTAEGGVYPSFDDVAKRIAESRALVFYSGYDPTGDQIHIGHSVSLLLMKALARELGHSVIVLFGDFTARIGDPTGKESTRRTLTEEEIEQHMSTWDKQIAALFGDVPYSIKYNSEWLGGMTFSDVIKLSAKVTVQQMLARDMFQERIKNERPIYLNEFLYPLAQGYDSVAMRVDGEVGGSEQTFNMLVGREFSKELIGKDKMVLSTPLILNSKTGKKMSKSEGELIALTDSPQEIRRKILDVDDGVVRSMFELCTETDQHWIDEHASDDPRQLKEELAAELIRMYHGADAVQSATTATEITATGALDSVLKESGLAASMSAAKKLIDQHGVLVNGVIADRWDLEIKRGDELRVGKGKFVRVV
jgi:tyrosyl-tRNA synthetase